MEISSKILRQFNLLAACLFVVLTVLPTDSRADTYGFAAISHNSGTDADTVAGQFSVEVLPVDGDQVSFTFRNTAVMASSITDIYFDDGALLDIAEIKSSTGVVFSQGANPQNLPGGGALDPDFETTAGFLADSDPAVSPNGVNAANEWVKIIFNLKDDMGFADVIKAINLGFTGPFSVDPPTLRIGLRAQSIGADKESDSFIMTPVPATILLGVLGLGCAGIKLRKLV